MVWIAIVLFVFLLFGGPLQLTRWMQYRRNLATVRAIVGTWLLHGEKVVGISPINNEGFCIAHTKQAHKYNYAGFQVWVWQGICRRGQDYRPIEPWKMRVAILEALKGKDTGKVSYAFQRRDADICEVVTENGLYEVDYVQKLSRKMYHREEA